MKKYRLELELFFILIIGLYFLPITNVLLADNNYQNLLFIYYPILFFITSTIDSRYSGNFYYFPIISTILYIPLAFLIFEINYLPCYFLYLFVAILGGLFGYWCNTNEEVRKSFKKAIGVSSIIAIIFTVVACAIDIYFRCYGEICDSRDIFSANIIQALIVIVLIILLAGYCFKKKKKKEK